MKLALFQTEPQAEGVTTALKRLNDAARTAGGHAADVLLTPEMYLTGYSIGAEAARAGAMTADGPTLQEVSEIAKRWSVGILLGYPERGQDDKIYNTAHLIGRTGATLSIYRKTHLWGEIDREQFSRGEALSEIVQIGDWKVGMAICYDIEFPEVARSLTLAGAEMILVPTASMKPYESIATQIVPARAEENEIAVAYCNYAGAERAIRYYGHSTVAGPDGKIIAQAGTDDTLMIADIDRHAFNKWRAENDHRRDRRTDLYGGLAG